MAKLVHLEKGKPPEVTAAKRMVVRTEEIGGRPTVRIGYRRWRWVTALLAPVIIAVFLFSPLSDGLYIVARHSKVGHSSSEYQKLKERDGGITPLWTKLEIVGTAVVVALFLGLWLTDECRVIRGGNGALILERWQFWLCRKAVVMQVQGRLGVAIDRTATGSVGIVFHQTGTKAETLMVLTVPAASADLVIRQAELLLAAPI